MRNNIAKWGNSLALRLPKHVAADAGLREGTAVDLRVDGRTLIVRPARPKYELGKLLADYQSTGRREVDWGKAEGEEAW